MGNLSRRDLTLDGVLTDTDIHLIAIDWIRYTVAKKNSQEQFDTAWASTIAMDMRLEDRFEDLWRLILAIHSLDQSTEVMQILSAGPIEDLLGKSEEGGKKFISRVEDKAKSDPSFAKVLGGVWKSTMSDEVWARLQAVWDRRGWDGIPE
jgi:hypothetical protein